MNGGPRFRRAGSYTQVLDSQFQRRGAACCACQPLMTAIVGAASSAPTLTDLFFETTSNCAVL